MFIIQYIIIGRKGVREKVLKIDEAFAPKVLRFDGGFAAEGCGGGWRRSIKGARLAPQVGADCVGRLCRRGLEKGSKGSEGSEGKVSPGGDEFYSQRYGIGFCVSSIAKQRVKDRVVD